MKKILLGLLVSYFAFADEGMWLYNSLPLETLKMKYDFVPTSQWTEHIMKSSARFNSGGSGSFISSNGLVLTNHHVASDTIEKISTSQKDYLRDGFYAKNLAEEIPAHDLEIDQLVSINDVTNRVKAVVKTEMSPAEALKAIQAEINTIEKEAQSKSGLKSEVVTLFKGGAYHLYSYKVYTDVRLVFAPEFSIAFFGGDPDNFQYPRYDLDMAILRVYENNKPAKIEHFLTWSTEGAKENELIFVSGHPGSTERLNTVAALEFRRDYLLPLRLELLQRSEAALLEYAKRGTEEARQAQGELFGTQNSRKVYVGRLEGLRYGKIIADKKSFESKLREQVEKSDKLKNYAKAWPQIAQAQDKFRKILVDYYMIERASGFKSKLFDISRTLVRLAYENQKPNGERLPDYRDSNRKALELELYSTAPIYPAFEEYYLAHSLETLVDKLGADHPVVKKVLQNATPAQLAKVLVQGTTVKDPETRKKIAAGGVAAIKSSADPMILLAVLIDEDARAVLKSYNDDVVGPEQEAYPQIAQAIYAINGSSVYPDATFTLRLAFGEVKGYQQDGEQVPPMTTMGGAFEHDAKHKSEEPYRLPDSWKNSKDKLDLSTPFNFVSTADIIGGNSGSPVVNRAGELVGLIFDGNIQSLILSYGYEDAQARAVSVQSSGMLEALKKIYQADGLVEQIGK